MPHYTNKVKVLSPLLAIAYSDNNGARLNYPTKAQTDLLLNGAAAARRIMRTAVNELDRVVYLRRPEGEPFTSIMNFHFGLAASRANPMLKSNVVDKPLSLKAIAEKDRRWVLNKIRMGMLSVSFHLNTGVYLIDVDIGVEKHHRRRTRSAGRQRRGLRRGRCEQSGHRQVHAPLRAVLGLQERRDPRGFRAHATGRVHGRGRCARDHSRGLPQVLGRRGLLLRASDGGLPRTQLHRGDRQRGQLRLGGGLP